MELQQNFNFITRTLKQTVWQQHICRKDFILNMKGKQKKKTLFFIFRFLEIRQYCAEPTNMVLCSDQTAPSSPPAARFTMGSWKLSLASLRFAHLIHREHFTALFIQNSFQSVNYWLWSLNSSGYDDRVPILWFLSFLSFPLVSLFPSHYSVFHFFLILPLPSPPPPPSSPLLILMIYSPFSPLLLLIIIHPLPLLAFPLLSLPQRARKQNNKNKNLQNY